MMLFKLHRFIQREMRNCLVVDGRGRGFGQKTVTFFYLKYAYCLRICLEEIRNRRKGHWITGPDTNGIFLVLQNVHMKTLMLSISSVPELGHVT